MIVTETANGPVSRGARLKFLTCQEVLCEAHRLLRGGINRNVRFVATLPATVHPVRISNLITQNCLFGECQLAGPMDVFSRKCLEQPMENLADALNRGAPLVSLPLPLPLGVYWSARIQDSVVCLRVVRAYDITNDWFQTQFGVLVAAEDTV